MSDVNTNELLAYIMQQQVPYTTEVGGLSLTVFPKVFPPQTPTSYDSQLLASLNDVSQGESVLDIGTGTGVHAILSAQRGAQQVVAVDTSPDAVRNCEYNAARYGLTSMIDVRQGHLFNPISPSELFDFIIANLPFEKGIPHSECEQLVLDPDYALHKEFFSKAPAHLKDCGRIHMAFADIGDVGFFENTLSANHLRINRRLSHSFRGIQWLAYDLRVRI